MLEKHCTCNFSITLNHILFLYKASGASGKEPAANAGNTRDSSSTPGWGKSPRVENGNPLQYSCLVNFMDWGVWWASVHGTTKSQTRRSTGRFLGRLWNFKVLSLHPQMIWYNKNELVSSMSFLPWQVGSLPLEPPGKPKWHVNVLLNSRAGKRADFYWFLVQYSANREMYSIIENDKYD